MFKIWNPMLAGLGATVRLAQKLKLNAVRLGRCLSLGQDLALPAQNPETQCWHAWALRALGFF
jgi:hypothetical protein